MVRDWGCKLKPKHRNMRFCSNILALSPISTSHARTEVFMLLRSSVRKCASETSPSRLEESDGVMDAVPSM
jgi:hypothetical protein